MARRAPGIDRFKNGYFDRSAVLAAVGVASGRAMSKAGAYVRQRAKSSLRYNAKSSQPGRPPTVWRDDRPGGMRRTKVKKDGTSVHRAVSPLKEFIFFAFDKRGSSVVVGPAATNQVFFGQDRRPVTGTVPGVLESGGQITILEVYKRVRVSRSLGRDSGTGRFRRESSREYRWVRADLRSRRRNAGKPLRYRTVAIAAHPFMRPAVEHEAPAFAGFFRSSVTGAGGRSRIFM